MPILYKHKLHALNGYKISDKYCGANMKKNTLRDIQPCKSKGANTDSEKGISEI